MTNEETFKEMLDRMKAECESCQYYYHCTYDRRIGFPFAMPNPMLYSFEERQKVYEYQEGASKKSCVSYLSRDRVSEALEKQIPKKSSYIHNASDKISKRWRCPNCTAILFEIDTNNCGWGHQADYCEDCGQAIDWSEDD